MDPHQIVQLLGPWAERKGPLYERLARALEQAIRTGELPPETRLPAERWLAQSLGISRSTIVAAYTLLQERGWVTSKRGSGTLVCAFSPKHSLRLRQKQLNPLARGSTIDSYLSEQREAIDFSTGAPPGQAGSMRSCVPPCLTRSHWPWRPMVMFLKGYPNCGRRLLSTILAVVCAPCPNNSW